MGIRSLSTSSISTGTKRSKVWDQSAVVLTGAYESIATVTGNGSANTLTISSIPQTYKHLQIRAVVKDNRSASDGDTFQFQLNGDTSATSPFNYSRHGIRATDSGITVYNVVQTSGENISMGVAPSSNANASLVSGTIVDVLDYTNTNKYKTFKTITGFDANGATTSYLDFVSGVWNNTSAITSITFVNNGSSAFTSTTKFALYGIKG